MNTKLLILLFLQAVITIIGVSAYSSRLAGVRTQKLSTAFSLYNILNLVSRFANMIFLPLLGALVETAIKNNNLNLLTWQFYFVLFSVLLGTVCAGFLLPTFNNFFERLVNKLSIHKNFMNLVIKETNIKNIKGIFSLIKFPKIKDLKKFSMKNLPKFSLFLSPIIVAVYTVGYLSALYAGALVPECRLVASQLSSTVNGIGTILLYLFVDPVIGVISDEVMSKKRDYQDLKNLIFYLCAGRVVGVMASFALLVPLATLIAKIAVLI